MNPNYIRSSYSESTPAGYHDMMRYLGVTQLPPEGMPSRKIQGVEVWVKPLPPQTHEGYHKRRNWHGLRVMCKCPQCGWSGAVGRMAQHVCRSKLLTFKIFWSPEGRCIATVEARNAAQALRKTPRPYRKYMGEVYVEEQK